MQVREAEINDVHEICTIFNECLDERGYANCESRTLQDSDFFHYASASAHRDNSVHLALVAVDDEGKVCGWASAKRLPVAIPWKHIPEIAIYVRRSERRHQVGKRLMEQLLVECKRRGFAALLAIILQHNRASVTGALQYGFERMAQLTDVAELYGQSESVLWLLRRL